MGDFDNLRKTASFTAQSGAVTFSSDGGGTDDSQCVHHVRIQPYQFSVKVSVAPAKSPDPAELIVTVALLPAMVLRSPAGSVQK